MPNHLLDTLNMYSEAYITDIYVVVMFNFRWSTAAAAMKENSPEDESQRNAGKARNDSKRQTEAFNNASIYVNLVR